MEEEKAENPLENIPMDITDNAGEKTIANSDSGELDFKSEVNQALSHNDLHLNADSSFITWENNSNICWLDASMALLAHNQTMRRVVKLNPDCQVSQIIKCYDDAIAILNDFASGKDTEERLNTARGKLLKVQESSLTYLQPLIKCKKGEPDSAFCSLLNLIKQDKLIQGFFDVTYAWVKQCENCEVQRVVTNTKPIITITHVDKFCPENHSSPTVCHSCNKKDQKMKLVFKKLPACLIFHFENGAGDGTDPPLSFLIASREYQLTGIMVLEKSQESNVNHFVTYIRDPSVNKWLECNDLNMDIVSFCTKVPDFNLKDVYIYVYEAFDDLGTIDTKEDSVMNNINQNIPCIDISDELDAVANMCQNVAPEKSDTSESEENIENIKAFLSNPFNESSNASLLEDKVCAQEHMDSLKSDSKDCLDSKMKDCDLSDSILHETNTENEVLQPVSERKIINNENNIEMKDISEPKVSGKSLVNQVSEKMEFNKTSKVVTPVSFDINSERWLNKLKSQFDKNEKPKNTHSSLTVSDAFNSSAGNLWSYALKNISTDSIKTLPVKAVRKCESEALNISFPVESRKESSEVDKSHTEDKEVFENHSSSETSNFGVKLGFNLKKIKISPQNKDEVSENIDRHVAKIGKINSKPPYAHKKSVNSNIVIEKYLSPCKIVSKQPESVQMSSSNVSSSEGSESLTSKTEIEFTQKEDSKNYNSSLMGNKMLDSINPLSKMLLKSSQCSWVLENTASAKETSDNLSENSADVEKQADEVAKLNILSIKEKNMKEILQKETSLNTESSKNETSPRTHKIIDRKKELINIQDLKRQKWVEKKVASPDKDKKKQINFGPHDHCGKRKKRMLHDTFKPDKEDTFSSDSSNHSVLGKKHAILEDKCTSNSGSDDKQLLLRMQNASLKKKKRHKSETSSYVPHRTGTSKNEFLRDAHKRSITSEFDESDEIQMANKIKKRNLQVRFKAVSLESKEKKVINSKKKIESVIESDQISESPVQPLIKKARIPNNETATDMDLPNASVGEVSECTNAYSKKLHLKSKPDKNGSIPIDEMIETKQNENFIDVSVKKYKSKSQKCSLTNNASVLKGEKNLNVNKQITECSPILKKRIVKSPMRYSSFASKTEKVPNLSVPKCSYSVADHVDKAPKQRPKRFSSLKNKSVLKMDPINAEQNDNDKFSEAIPDYSIKYFSDDSEIFSSGNEITVPESQDSETSPSSSLKLPHKSISTSSKFSCANSKCTCKSDLLKDLHKDHVVDLISDNIYLGFLEIFGIIPKTYFL